MTACDRSSLVEASLDGRLGPAERLSLERHLASCAVCTTEQRALEQLRAAIGALREDVTPLEHQRARLGLLRRAAAPATRGARSRRPAALVAAALVFVPVAVWAAMSTFAPPHAPKLSEADEVVTPAPVPTLSVAPVIPSLPVVPVSAEPEEPAPVPAAAPPARSHASRDFADAMDAIARGDFGAGARKLDQFAREHPTDPRAEEALYLEAIALERAGRLAEAKAVASRYLAAYPDGAHRARAQRLLSN